jgi:hypothetical protein
METPPRHYMALAFLPVILAVVTLVGLYLYQQGAKERRDRWQKPEAVLDAIGVGPGMRAAEWMPSDTYFLEKLLHRVGSDGHVFAIVPPSRVSEDIAREIPSIEILAEPPTGLDAILSVHITMAKQDLEELERTLVECSERLNEGGRIGVIGFRSERLDAFLPSSEVKRLATDAGLEVVGEEHFMDRQFLVVLERN